MSQQVDEIIDSLEAIMVGNFPLVDCKVEHKFAPGMYIRKIYMPAGIDVTSMSHKMIHPFFLMTGKVSVFSENDGVQELEAPCDGITYCGTRRILRVHENAIWITCHRTDIRPKDATKESIDEAVKLICAEIIEQRENKILGGVLKNNEIIPMLETSTINSLNEAT